MKSGTSVHTSHLSLRSLTLDKSNPSRFSCVVPKKIASKATSRNALRRTLYRALRLHLAEVKPGIIGIIFAKSGAGEIDIQECAGEIDTLIKKAYTH